MNHSQLNEEIIDRLSSSKTYSLMKEFQEKVSLFPANQMELKQKREKVVFEASEKVYSLTTIFKSLVHEFSNSIVLICNETCVQYMIEEAEYFNCNK